MLKCHKCGAELHPDQKVCIACGTRTAVGGNFVVDEEKSWRPTRQMIIAAGIMVVFVIGILIANGMRAQPPEVVAKAWFEAMSQRQMGVARNYISDEFKNNMVTGVSDLPALSDNYFDAIVINKATYSMSAPVLDVQDRPTKATVTVIYKFQDGHDAAPVVIELKKIGRRWLVCRAN